MGVNMDNKGYESRCKLCNSKLMEKIESMRKEGQTYEEIKNFMDSNGEKISLMAISRHFGKHYPKKIEYLQYMDKMKSKEETAIDNIIKETVKLYPFLQEYLQEEAGIYNLNEESEENIVSYKDVFLNKFGFCTTGQQFCQNVPKTTVYDVEDVLTEIDSDLDVLNTFQQVNFDKHLKLLEKKVKCTNCRTFYNEVLLEFFIYLALFNKGIDGDIEEIRRLLFKEFDCDYEKMKDYLILNQG